MKLYSLKEIRHILDTQGIHIPDGTLRNYRDAFDDLLPKEGSGRISRYHEGAFEIFKNIRRLREDKRLEWEEIRKYLTGELKEAPEPVEEKTAAPPPPDVLVEELTSLADSVRNLDIRTKITADNVVKLVSVLQQRFIAENQRYTQFMEEIKSSLDEIRNIVTNSASETESRKDGENQEMH